jgi:hypothetical protein
LICADQVVAGCLKLHIVDHISNNDALLKVPQAWM